MATKVVSGSDHPQGDGAQPVDAGRRRFLTVSTAVVGAVGVAGASVPFIKSWMPSARAKLAGAPVTVDISALGPGQQITVKWRGQPVFVSHRTKAMLDVIKSMNDQVADPSSGNADQQPKYAQNEFRSIKPEILVVVGVCTHLGCAPDFLPEVKPQAFDPDWKGGYFCPCHKSRYDLAGRVLKSQPAPANLPVPPYRFEKDGSLIIGLDPEGSA